MLNRLKSKAIFWVRMSWVACIWGTVWILMACSSAEHASELLKTGWVGPSTEARAQMAKRKTLYCYKTLGNPDCYEAPQHPFASRLLGVYEPVPPPQSKTP